MYPVLTLGPLSIPIFPLALLLALYVGLTLGGRVAERHGVDGNHIWNLGQWAILGGVVAARLTHAATFWSVYQDNLWQLFAITPGSLRMDAGLLVAAVIGIAYAQRLVLPGKALFDALVIGFLGAMVIAAPGMLLAGIAVGAPTRAPWAVELFGVARHPVQLYDALAALLAAAIAWRTLAQGSVPGAAGLVGLALYASGRVFIEAFRGDSALLLAGLRSAQVAFLIIAVVALLLLARYAAPAQQSKEA